jgi:hypothetical protein
MKYYATLRHHSISGAREITINGTLQDAKDAAAHEFDADFQDYEIVIYEAPEGRAPEIVSSREVSAKTWRDRP